MREIAFRLTGTTPLMMHNKRLANPLDEYAKAIKKISSLRKKTDDDHHEMARLEWFGGIYADEQGPYAPSEWVKGCLIEAGKTRKMGIQFDRSVHMKVIGFPVLYDGPREPKALWQIEKFRDIRPVRVGSARVMRSRPIFHDWQVEGSLLLVTETLNYEDFAAIFSLAGIIQGIGEGQKIGMGRFTVKIGGAK